ASSQALLRTVADSFSQSALKEAGIDAEIAPDLRVLSHELFSQSKIEDQIKLWRPDLPSDKPFRTLCLCADSRSVEENLEEIGRQLDILLSGTFDRIVLVPLDAEGGMVQLAALRPSQSVVLAIPRTPLDLAAIVNGASAVV